MNSGRRRWLRAFLLLLAVCGGPAAASDLGAGRLNIAGTRLAISPESQTVPFNTPTIVETELIGFAAAEGPLPADLRVLADFTGPEIDGVLVLETVPGEPFRIPRLSLKGQYQLDNIRLVEGEDLLAYAEPRSAGVLVTQVLVTRVTSRPLTLDEIRSYGVVVGDESFQAFNFTFGFAVGGETFDYNLPVLYTPVGGGKLEILADMAQGGPGGSTGTTAPRFRPPQMAPFNLKLEPRGEGEPVPTGGCGDAEGDCFKDAPVTLPGVILFPTDVSLLHQFFSVVLLAKNDAPEGDALRIRDLAARVVLPPGLRMAKTEPPTPLGVPVPVRVPGPDGKLGTGDDLTFLVAQAEGQAEAVVEGLQQGTHIVEFQLEGTLAGLPGNEVRRISGTARGAVVVRDPALSMTITHPDVVRAGEPYTLRLTVANTSASPVNLLSITLPPTGLSGVELAAGETNVKTIPTLLPGDAEVVEFDLVSRRTGKVVASSVRSASAIDPRFELVVGVGDAGIPLSPTALVLPKSTEELPEAMVRHALSLLGLGWSLATAPASLTTDLPRLGLEEVHEKVYWLGQAGRHVKLGEEPFDSLAVLALEWTGARDRDWEWDDLRRRTQKGGLWESEMGSALSAGGPSPMAVLDRFAATTAFLGRIHGALAAGNSASVEVSSRASGKIVAGLGTDPGRRRELPFAGLFRLDLATDGQMVTLAVPEEGGYRARLRIQGGGTADLHLLVPEADGTLRRVSWTGVALSAAGTASADFKSSFLDSELVLNVDADGDGVAEDTRPGTVAALSPRAFTALAAVQNELEPSGHMIEVLFTQDVDLRSLLPADPGRFKIPGKVSNGGLVPIEEDIANFFEVVAENPFEGLRDTRIVRVIFDNPVSPLVANELTVRDLESVSGQALSNVVLPVLTTVTDPGAKVQGTVYGPDGLPVPFARVELFETDFFYHYPTPCRQHKTAAVQADANGRYAFDYVRQTFCGDVFSVAGTDPGSGKHGASRARVRFVNQTQEVDIVMLGRGTIRGRVRYDNGDIPADVSVIAYSPVFFEGREARLGVDGTYEVGDVPVGTVTLGASDRDGGYVFQTVEIPVAGAVVERDLTIIRRPAARPVGDVRGSVVETDNVTPVFNAYLALYVNGELVGVERSGYDGRFDFGTVPAGLAQIEAFDGETGLTGAQVTFDIEPDQVNEVPIRLRDDRGTVQGHVYVQTLSSVAPLAGAVVWVSGTPFNTVTDASGFYRLDGVFAGDRTVLAADLARNRQTSAIVSLTGNGQTVTRDLYFVESVGSGLTGEVVGFSGNPVPGATVHLSTGGDQWFGTAVTDAAGRFVFPNLAVGTYSVHAVKGQDGGVQQATIRFQGETPSIRIQFKKGTIRGAVRTRNESGQLVGVRSLVTYRTTVVRGEMVGLDWDAHTLETSADGTFELPNALVGRYVLTVSNAFHGEKTVRGELLFANQIAEHEFVFEPNGTIRGVVLDWDGTTPAAGARVFLRHPSFSIYDLTTDAAGKFQFELVPPGGTFPIDATINSGAISRQARIWVTFNRFGQEMDVEIRLPRQGSVNGQVEDANGNPVPGAVVTLREHGFPQRQLIQNADSQGRFSFTNIFAGKVALTAKAPSLGGLGAHANLEIVDEGEEVFALLALEATGEIAGRVLSPENGQPVATVQVSLHRSGGVFDVVTSDADGAFRFRLLPLGDYLVWVFDPRAGRHGRSGTLKVQGNNQVVERDVVLEARGNVDGHLYEPNATAGIPGATIQLQTRSLVPFHTFSSTDVDGGFEFQGIPEGTFTLSTREPGGRRRASGEGAITEEDQNVTVDLFLEESGRVIGSVLNPVGAAEGLFPNSNTLIYQDGQVVGATLQNPFEFDGIIADRGFEVKAFEVGGDHRAAKLGQLTQQGEEVTVSLRMVPIGSLAVTVRDSFDNPVPGANVQVWSNGFYGQKGFSGNTGADGRVSFSGAGEGALSVYATHPVTGLRGSGNGAIASEGQVAQIAVRLEDSGRIRGRAVKANGTDPAAEALVVLTRAGRTLQTLADADGWFSFASVPLGPFTIFIQERLGPGRIERGGTIAANGQEVDLGVLRLDDSDPFVVALAPDSNSRDLPLSTAVTIELNEPLDRARFSGGWVSFRTLGGAGVAFALSWEAGDTVMRLTPNAPLASFTGYEVIVWDAYDLAGRRLSSRARTAFHTVDVLPPNVIDVLPRDGQSQVPLSTLIKVTFSEPVTLASLSGNALQLTDLTTGLGITTTFLQLPGGREVLITRAVALENNHRYQVRVQGVQDGGGNTMAQPVTTTFWTPDTIPPQIQDVLPAEGTVYTAGDRIPVAVTATDERGLGAATISYAGWTFTDPAAPYAWSVPAPVVSEPSDVAITVKVKDIFGNESTAVRTVRAEPRVNANPPQVEVGCAEDGDAVVPGIDAELLLDASDDEAIERYRFLVDGAVVQETSPVDAPTAEASFLWRPPANAAAGTSFLVRIEARDFAGNVGARELTVSVPAGVILKGSQSLGLSRSGQALILAGGTFLVRDRLPLASVTMLRGATLSAPDDNPEVELEVAGALKLQCGATVRPGARGNAWLTAASANIAPGALVDVSLQGYPGGQEPAGVPGATGDYGSGSHGGRGWPSGDGVVYGSIVEPRLGGAGEVGGNASGGGIVEIGVAGDLRLGGEIRGLGEDGCHGGAGAGGSVLLRGATLRGDGLIDVSGGRESLNCSWDGGLGGGGRVAIHGTLDGFTAEVRAWGGAHRNGQHHAAPGTVYYRSPVQTYGVLVIDRGETDGVDRKGVDTELPTLGAGAVASFAAAGGDAWIARSGGFREEWIGAWVVLLDAGGAEIGAFRVAAIDAQGRARLAGAGSIAGASGYRGEHRFDRIELRNGATLTSASPLVVSDLSVSGDVKLAGEVRADSLTVKAGAILRPVSGSGLHFIVSGAMRIEAGALIDLSSLGYGIGAAPPGVTPASDYANGGTHGGDGGNGEIYDSVYGPWLPGAGGTGGVAPGKPGGGVVRIAAGSVQLDGEIRVRGGETCGAEGGGAGGAVFIAAAGTLSGSGLIDATGGAVKVNANCGAGNPGGGGRVALQVGSFAGFDPALQVKVGGGIGDQTDDAGAGTLLTRTAEQTYGSLRVDQRAASGTRMATGLAAIGRGTIGATYAGADAADLWIEPQDAAAKFGLGVAGAWTRIDGIDYRILELSSDRRRILLEGAAGAVAAGQAYAGIYKFDSIEVTGRANLVLTDLVVVTGSTVVEAGSALDWPDGSQIAGLELRGDAGLPGEVRAASVTIGSGATVRPASGGGLRFVVSGLMTVEAGATVDVSGTGYSGAKPGHADGYAPDGVPGASGPYAGGAHGGRGLNGTSQVFDSVYEPRLGGGGGAWGTGGGTAGGGVLRIEAGQLVLDGEMRSSSSKPCSAGGGAGGTIAVTAGSMSGSGSIDASGSDEPLFSECNFDAGAGGGGRVALSVGSFAGFDPAVQARAWGGRPYGGSNPLYAAPGTVYYRVAGQQWGVLLIDNGQENGVNRAGLLTELPALGSGGLAGFEAAGADAWVSRAGGFAASWRGAWMVLKNAAGASLGTFRVADLDAQGRALLAGAGAVAGASAYAGEYRFDRIDVLHGSSYDASDPVAGAELVLEGDLEVASEIRGVDVRIKAGARVRPVTGGELRILAAGKVTIEPGALIDLASRGYGIGAAPPGVTPASGYANGGTHGGAGGIGDFYDSVYEPWLPGAGGTGGNASGKPGGGVVRIEAGSVQLDGEIRVRGGATCGGEGGGAGGAVYVEAAGTFSGSGLIDASGGAVVVNANCGAGNAGGGGRVALQVGSFSGFDPAIQVKVEGGAGGPAGAGTLLTRTAEQTHGSLRVDQRVTSGDYFATGLAVIGRGTIGATYPGANAADLWIEPQDTAAKFGLGVAGAWTRVDGVDYRILELSSDRRRILLEGAAAAVSAGQAYAGVYKLDGLTVAGRANLVLKDLVVVTGGTRIESGSTLNVTDDSELGDLELKNDAWVKGRMRAGDLVVRSGAVVRPATGHNEVRILATGDVTLETGALIDVSSLGYARGAAPPGIAPASGWANGGTHGGAGGVGDFYDSVYEPSLSGAGGTSAGGAGGSAGGGVVWLEGGTFRLDGEIRARGQQACNGGAGAGGAVSVRVTGAFSGSGSIDATGGTAPPSINCNAGNAGGGGRVALHAGSFVWFDPAVKVQVQGGAGGPAGAGTLLTRTAAQAYGSLRVDQRATSGDYFTTGLAVIGSGTIGATYPGANASDLWIEPQDASAKFGLGVAGAWTRVDGVDYRILELSSDRRRILLQGAAASVAAGQAYAGVYKFDSISVAGRARVELGDLAVVTGSTNVEDGSTLRTVDGVVIGNVELKSGETWVEEGRMHVVGNLTVRNGAVVRPASGGELSFIVTGTMTIEGTAQVGASERGYGPGGAPPGVAGASGPADGGTHGGWGGAGEFYDSLYEPRLPGGGGTAGSGSGKSGGGAVYVEAGALVLNGQLRVLGGDSCGGGGGAGGAVLVRVAGVLSGSGSVIATGGLGGCTGGKPGGGGRVALHVGSFSGFNPATQVSVQGGNTAGAGTLFTRTASQTHGSLRVDGRATSGTLKPTEPPAVGSGIVGATFPGPNAADLWIEAQDPAVKFGLGVAGIWTRINGVDYRILELSPDRRRLLLEGAAASVSAGQPYVGVYKLDSLTVTGRAQLVVKDLVVVTGSTKVESASTLIVGDDSELGDVELKNEVWLQGRMRMNSLVARSGAVVRPASGSSELRFLVAGTVTIEGTALVGASALGYGPGGAPPGVTGASGTANGGTHGGWGGVGEFYDSLYEPWLPGAGGTAGTSAGTSGGGVTYVEAGALVLNGQLRVLGQDAACSSGGGSGGTIFVRVTGALSGSGSVIATGGLAGCASSKPGGGGRVALHVGSFSGFNPNTQVQVQGGTGVSGAGTLFTKTPAQTYGSLRVDQRASTSNAKETTPATIGRGIVGATYAGANAADLWIEPQDSAVKLGLGVAGIWTRINGVDYKVLELSSDRRRLLLQGAAGTVTVGQRYVGIYKLDSLSVAGRAKVEFKDGLVVTGTTTVDSGSTLILLDIDPPAAGITEPAAGTLYASGEAVTVKATATDAGGIASVTFRLGEQSFTDTAAPYEWTVAAPVVETEGDLQIVVTAQDAATNEATATRTIRVRPLAPANPPVVALTCPTPGALLAPGTGLDFHVTATHDNGIEKVELLLGGSVLATDLAAPYVLRFTAPAGALDGDVLQVKVRARSYDGNTAELTFPVTVVAGGVINADLTLSAADQSLDGQSVVVAGGTLTVQGTHSFRDLVVLDGARVTHAETTSTQAGSLVLGVERDLYLACGASIDVTGRGYVGAAASQRAYGYPNSQAEGAQAQVGGSHGGRGGRFDGSSPVYGNLFDPQAPGAGGGYDGSTKGRDGGGVVRVTALGNVVLDGALLADGEAGSSGGGAGGSVLIHAGTLSGAGRIQANGSAGSNASSGGGSGGRVALYAASVDAGLLGRTTAAGAKTASTDATRWGAAGTIYVQRDADAFGELIVDNEGTASTQLTELPAVWRGVVDAVGATDFTDNEADFRHGLAGLEVAFNDDLANLYVVQGHGHHGQTLSLQVPVPPLSALVEPGDTYRGVVRFDRVTVRGGARVLSVDRVESTQSPAVESGSEWTESYTPVVQITSPAAGATFTAGDPVAIAATVQDVLGVRDVVFRLGTQTGTDAASPYAWTVMAPSVTAPTDLEVTATATDNSGNRIVATLTIHVLPSSDAVAPSVSLTGCVVNDDAVLPGVAVSLPFLITDDNRIERYSFRVDGQVVETIQAPQVSVSSTWTWTPPAGAAAGQVFALQIDAVDYGGSVGSASLALRIPSTPAHTGTQTLTSALDGTHVYLASGTFTAQGTLAPASLTLLPGAKLTGVAGQTVKVAAAGDIRVQCGASVDVTGLGYPGTTAANGAGGAPAGVSPAVVDGGGSHGGPGSVWIAGPPGAVFDSVYLPTLGGGGGSLVNAGYRSGAGGGVIDLTAARLVLGGELKALGEERPNRNSDTPGAGGTVVVYAGEVRGAGTIDASGGKYDVQYYGGGSGGGGRVALYVGSFAGFDPLAQVKAWGGFVNNPNDPAWNRYAAPGTVFLKRPGDTYGRLVIDSGEAASGVDRAGPVTPLPTLGSGTVASIEVAGADLWVAGASAFKVEWLGAWMELKNASGGLAGTYQVLAIDAGGRARLANAASASSAATFQGVYLFDRIDLRNGAGLSASDPIETAAMQTDGNVRLPAGMTAEALTLKPGTVIPAAGGTLQLQVTGMLTVEAGALLDVTGKGYPGTTLGNSPGGAPAGVTPSVVDAGGSHGGLGSIWVAGPAGAVFDSVYEPSLGGGGGSLYKAYSGNRSGAGGGVIDITAGHLVLDGELRAKGEERPRRDSDTPGAGGTVRLRAGILSGAGTIDASGGRYDVQVHGGGSGGGGRVALHVDVFQGFDPLVQVKAWGGLVDNPNDRSWNRYAGPGTVFIKSLGDTYGRLVVDSGEASPGVDRVGPVTPLPLLGSGAVTAVEAAGSDLWVAGPAAFKSQWLGAWMELLGSSGSSLGKFRAVALDGAGRARLAGASGAAAAASFRGIYLFDRLDLRNGAGLSSDDPLEVGTMQTDGNARLPVSMTAGSVTLKSGGVATVHQGGALRMTVTGTMTVEAGAVLSVSNLGYPGTTAANGAGGAPPNVAPAVVDGGGSHGGPGSVWVHGPPGAVFDSVYEPSLGGGGGSLVNAGYRSGAGGGVIDITAGHLVLDGELRAKGEERPNRNSDTPGAGGTILVRAGLLSGTGTIDVAGGKYDVLYYGGGSGGGGRAALYVNAFQGFDPVLQVNARGGAVNNSNGTPNRYAGPGTIFVKLASQTHGRLIVDQGGTGGLSVRNTPLPSIGIGTVGLTQTDAADSAALWIEPADSAARFSLGTLGMWVRIDGSDYRVIGQTADLRRLLLAGAAGIVDAGDAYRGVYKFDEVTVRGGAKLEFRDTNEVGTWNVDPTSSVIQNVP
jgi:hypothetical protein